MNKLVLFILTLMFYQTSNAADSVAIACSYDTYSDIKGNHKVEKEFKLRFMLDHEKRTASIIGNQVGSKVSYLPTNNGLSLIETTTAGNLTTTTIDRLNNSVHSRNTITNGVLTPAQFYGKCETEK